MRFLVIYVLVVTLAALLISAYVFQSRRASEWLVFLKRVGWGYVIAMLIVAGYQAWQEWG